MARRIDTSDTSIETLRATLENMSPEQITALLSDMTPTEANSILDAWDLWAMPHQRLPKGAWRRWIIRAGRGSGKTKAAAKAINLLARDKAKIGKGEIGIIARTYKDVRYTCIEGSSGVLAEAPSDFKPAWHPGTGLLVWPNGVRGRIFSADKPEGMRGPNWSLIWGDEIATWPNLKKTWWEVIEPALRVGWARAILTTTPIPLKFLKELEAKENTVVTRATTFDNRWLAKSVKDGFREQYEGSRLGRQELYGEFVEANLQALWRYETIENTRVRRPPTLKRIVVAIDPAVTANEDSDETGIIVMGTGANNHGYVLHDASGIYTPTEWATKAIGLFHRYEGDRIVAENNQGGDMIEAVLRAVDPKIPYAGVRATRGKVLRAEPVAALYERGLVHHVGVFPKLEEQLTDWTPGQDSPDRLDALVWASTYLQLGDKPIGDIRGYL